MEQLEIVSFVLIALNVLTSYKGFKDYSYFSKYAFRVDDILIGKEHQRLFSSGFLHTGWWHLGFNMLTLYFFSSLEGFVGALKYSVIYLASLLGGNLFALFVHRNHGDYSAVGASGAVCGVIFASIAVMPGIEIGFFFLPIYMPAWLYGLLFVGFSIYGIKSQLGNIGHEAHLGGALVGMLTAVAFYPLSLKINTLAILLTFIPTVIFILLIIKKPELLYLPAFKSKRPHFTTIEDRYHTERKATQAEIDRILEKIHRKGEKSLTAEERRALEEFSRK